MFKFFVVPNMVLIKVVSLQIICEYFIQCAKQRNAEIEKYMNLRDKVAISTSNLCKEQNQAGRIDNSKLSNQTEMPKMLSDKANVPDKLPGSGSVPSRARYSEYSAKFTIRPKSNGPRLRLSTITQSQPVTNSSTDKTSTKVTQLSDQEPSGVVLRSTGVDGISSEVLEYCRTQSSSAVETENQNTAGSIVPEPPMSRNGQYSLNGRDPRYSRHLLDLVTTLALQNEVSDVLLSEKIETIDLRLETKVVFT